MGSGSNGGNERRERRMDRKGWTSHVERWDLHSVQFQPQIQNHKIESQSPISWTPGERENQGLIGQDYWWPRMWTDILKYVEGCNKCQRSNTHCQKSSNPLNP